MTGAAAATRAYGFTLTSAVQSSRRASTVALRPLSTPTMNLACPPRAIRGGSVTPGKHGYHRSGFGITRRGCTHPSLGDSCRPTPSVMVMGRIGTTMLVAIRLTGAIRADYKSVAAALGT